jgi:hypothetical protein
MGRAKANGSIIASIPRRAKNKMPATNPTWSPDMASKWAKPESRKAAIARAIQPKNGRPSWAVSPEFSLLWYTGRLVQVAGTIGPPQYATYEFQQK